MADTAVLSVWDALASAIQQGTNPPKGPSGETILATQRVYRGAAPSTAALGYFLFGIDPENEAGFYNQRGQSGLYRVHCWATTPTNANRLYQWLKHLVHDVTLPLENHQMLSGKMTKGGAQADTDRKAWQVPADYRVESLEA